MIEVDTLHDFPVNVHQKLRIFKRPSTIIGIELKPQRFPYKGFIQRYTRIKPRVKIRRSAPKRVRFKRRPTLFLYIGDSVPCFIGRRFIQYPL